MLPDWRTEVAASQTQFPVLTKLIANLSDKNLENPVIIRRDPVESKSEESQISLQKKRLSAAFYNLIRHLLTSVSFCKGLQSYWTTN